MFPIWIYVVGSYLKRYDPRTAIVDPIATQRFIDEQTAGRLVVRGGGEWRDAEANWIVWLCRRIYNSFGIGEADHNNGLRYRHYLMRALRVLRHWRRVGSVICSSRLPAPHYAVWAEEDRKLFDQIQEETGRSTDFMRGLPSPRAVAFFSGVPFGHLQVFERVIAAQMKKILSDHPDTVIQWELPVETALAAMPLPNKLRQRLLRCLVASFERVIREAPKGTRFAFHLCWGDLEGRPFVPRWLQSTRAKVRLINSITEMKVWREGWELYAIHDPLCDGKHPPKRLHWHYRHYDHIRPFPTETIYALGLLHPQRGAEATERLVRHLMARLGAQGVERFAIASPCGDGRKPYITVCEIYTRALEVLRRLGDPL